MNKPYQNFYQANLKRLQNTLKSALEFSSSNSDALDFAAVTKLRAAMAYSLLSGGKRLRSMLVYCAAYAIGKEQGISKAVDKAAIAVEMLHTYSLIHDDMPCMDDSPLRRQKPSCHIEYGEAIALLAGSALQILGIEVLATMETSPEVRLDSIVALTRAAGVFGIAGGQAADLEQGNYSNSDYLRLYTLKTAILMETSLLIGGFCAGATPQQQTVLRQCGQHLGIAFQLRDDIHDALEDEKRQQASLFVQAPDFVHQELKNNTLQAQEIAQQLPYGEFLQALIFDTLS